MAEYKHRSIESHALNRKMIFIFVLVHLINVNTHLISFLLLNILFLMSTFSKAIKAEMIFEMKLIEFKNPLNRTYSNKPCGGTYGPNGELLNSNEIFSNITLKYAEDKECQTGFLFCLVDLPFRNPQNCSLGDYTTPVLGTNHIVFSPNASHNFTYKFTINKLPSVTFNSSIFF